MKLDFEVHDDQLALLQRFRELPDMIHKHIGDLPTSFPPSSELDRIKELCLSFEFKWKQWIWQSFLTNSSFDKCMEGTTLAKSSEYRADSDY